MRHECFCCGRLVGVTARGKLWRHVFGDAWCPGSGEIADDFVRRLEARNRLAWRQILEVIRGKYKVQIVDAGWYRREIGGEYPFVTEGHYMTFEESDGG